MLLFEAIFSVTTMWLSIYLLTNSYIKKLDLIKNIFITSLLCYIVSLINKSLTLLAFGLLGFYLLFKILKNLKKTFFILGLSITINIFAIYISTYFHSNFKSSIFPESPEILLLLFYVYIFILVFLITKLINIILEIKFIEFTEKNIYLNISIISLLLFVCLSIYNTIFEIVNYSTKALKIYSLVTVFSAIFLFFLIIKSIKTSYITKELDLKKQELLSLQNYITTTERYYSEMRKFKHDYVNIITTLAGYIEDKNLEDLETYFNKNIVHLPTTFNNEILKLNTLDKLKLLELNGLMKVKLAQAIEKKINISIEILEDINDINWETLELCRSVGILLDNAIEATEISENPFINIAIFMRSDFKYIIIQNSFIEKNISLQQLYKKGFSTKGKNRGIGLSTINEFIDKNINISLETDMQNQIFTQILKIQN